MLVDLHVHLRGTITAATARRLASRNGFTITPSIFDTPRFGWHDFSSFLRTYDAVTTVVSTALDLEEVTYLYLSNVAAQQGIYVEFMLSPPDLARLGIPIADQLSAIQAAADQARDEHGIECRLIATAVRHLGGEAAIEAAKLAADNRRSILVGFGLTGDERCFPIRNFEEAFRIVRSAGLRTTAHAGEHLGPETIIESIERLGLDRVGHGVRAAESASVTRQLAAEGIPLEVCLSSNLALGLYPDLASHPIAALVDAGCTVVLGTDDPGFFDTSLAREYHLAAESLGNMGSKVRLGVQAIAAAFCDERTKADLQRKIRGHA